MTLQEADFQSLETLPNEQLMPALASLRHATSGEIAKRMTPERLSTLLAGRFLELERWDWWPAQERLRLRLGCALHESRLSPDPWHAQRAQRAGESFWIDLQLGAFNL